MQRSSALKGFVVVNNPRSARTDRVRIGILIKDCESMLAAT
jgi:hypothetical protein